jgi:formylmethanofuran dehydrogenase subunit C
MTITLKIKTAATLPIEVEGVLPETCVGKSLAQIETTPIFFGKEKLALAELFAVSGSADDERLVFEGNCRSVHWIGAKMARGEIRVEGSAGRHLGSQMSGGTIGVTQDCGDWIGAEMRGGRIEVHGSAGHQAGAAYRGSARGMRGGEILIHQDAGNEVGARMRRGLIAIAGSCGDSPGYAMLAGTILLFGQVGHRPGANMKRGTLACFAAERPELLPTFRMSSRFAPSFMPLLLKALARRGFSPPGPSPKVFDLYNGDFLEGGRGEILMAAR